MQWFVGNGNVFTKHLFANAQVNVLSFNFGYGTITSSKKEDYLLKTLAINEYLRIFVLCQNQKKE